MNRGAEQPDYSPDGVDLTLIRWFLTLTPAERLTALKEHLSALERMRKLNRNDRLPRSSPDSLDPER